MDLEARTEAHHQRIKREMEEQLGIKRQIEKNGQEFGVSELKEMDDLAREIAQRLVKPLERASSSYWATKLAKQLLHETALEALSEANLETRRDYNMRVVVMTLYKVIRATQTSP